MTHTEFLECASVFIFNHSYAEFANSKNLLTIPQSLFSSNQLTEPVISLIYIVGAEMKNNEF